MGFRESAYQVSLADLVNLHFHPTLSLVHMLTYSTRNQSDAMRIDDKSPEVLSLRGLVFLLTNQIPKAVSHAQGALRLDPEFKPARIMLKRARTIEQVKEEGNRLFKAGRLMEAVKKYGETLDLVGESEEEGAFYFALFYKL